jgi:hypothetical protein
MRYAIKVIWKNGDEEYVMSGLGKSARIATFSAKSRARTEADFMAMGIDDAQSINVVRAPAAHLPRPSSGEIAHDA